MTKLGKYKNCKKKLARYGLSETEQEIACARFLIGDDEWEVEARKKIKTGFEIKKPEKPKTPEQKKSLKGRLERLKALWSEYTPAGGKGAGVEEPGKRRPVKTVPLSAQLPLYQPWRGLKSQHRLQTKLERIQTSEEKFLTHEQLQKRSQYAVAIKKRDSNDYIYTINELLELCENIEDLKEKITIIKL